MAAIISFKNAYFCTNVVVEKYQRMNIFVPAEHFEGGEVCGYTAETAPIVLMNNCSGWRSGSAGAVDKTMIENGFVFVSCGARSRDAGGGDFSQFQLALQDELAAAFCDYIDSIGIVNAEGETLGFDGTRNGTADEHTSFSVAFDLAMSALMAGAESVDYSLVWAMPHGSDEGTSTGTFVEWVHSICNGTAPET